MDLSGESSTEPPSPAQLGVTESITLRPLVWKLSVGWVVGVLAWTFSYAVTFFLYRSEIEGTIVSQAVDTSQIVGLLFFNAHTVPAELVHPYDLSTHNFLAAGAASPILYVLPPIVLTLAGLFIAFRVESTRQFGRNIQAGSTIVVGYAVCSLLGVIVFTATSGDTQFRPALPGALLLAGILYPLVFGALGGAIASFARNT